MLFMLFKNFMWAAWWPYYTALLTMEKVAAQQAAANRAKSSPQQPPAGPVPPRSTPPPPRPELQPVDRGAVRQEHSRESSMSDAFKKPEQALRELMKLSIEQAKRAFETFVATSEKTWKSLENASPAGRASLFALNAKIAEITRLNAEANFALATRLAKSNDFAQAIELQSQHVRQQMETFVRQLEEMRDLAAQMIQDANSAARTDFGGDRGTVSGSSGPRSAASGSSSGFSSSSYAPSSSFTPGGETGRTY